MKSMKRKGEKNVKLSIEELVILLTACQFAVVHPGDEWDRMSEKIINELQKRRNENG